MTTTETYAAGRPIPYLLQRGASQEVTCPVRYGETGALVAPDSGTVTIEDPTGTELVSGAAVTVTSSVARYTLALAASATLGEGYTLIWSLTFGSVTHTYRFDGFAGDYVPYNVISADKLFVLEPELQHRVPQSQGSSGTGEGWQPQIDAAYYELIQQLLDDGRPIWRIRSFTGLLDRLRYRALELACRALATSDESVWWGKATHYQHELERAEGRMRVQYDDEDAAIKRGGSPTIRVCPVGRPRC